jgi:hypothetical protein
MTLILDCLAIVEPGYRAPDAARPVDEPRIKPAYRMCACGVEEVVDGRTMCKPCIAKTPSGRAEQTRKNRRGNIVNSQRLKAKNARLATLPPCACGRPAKVGATCGRRRCR